MCLTIDTRPLVCCSRGCRGVFDIFLEFPRRWGVTASSLKWKIRRCGGSYTKFPLWWGHGYFLEPHSQSLSLFIHYNNNQNSTFILCSAYFWSSLFPRCQKTFRLVLKQTCGYQWGKNVFWQERFKTNRTPYLQFFFLFTVLTVKSKCSKMYVLGIFESNQTCSNSLPFIINYPNNISYRSSSFTVQTETPYEVSVKLKQNDNTILFAKFYNKEQSSPQLNKVSPAALPFTAGFG